MFTLSQLPERFQAGPRSQLLTNYIDSKYSKYGFRRTRSIEYNPEFPASDNRYNSDYYRWVENTDKGLRFVGRADDLIRLDHKGWYIDNFQDETVHGEVFQLPARNGEPQFIPAVNDPCNDNSSVVDFRSVTSDKEDCARTADRMAELWAERAREDQTKQDAEDRLEEIAEEIETLYSGFRDITREIRANCDKLQGVAVVRELVKDKWRSTKAAILKLKREAKRIADHGMEY